MLGEIIQDEHSGNLQVNQGNLKLFECRHSFIMFIGTTFIFKMSRNEIFDDYSLKHLLFVYYFLNHLNKNVLLPKIPCPLFPYFDINLFYFAFFTTTQIFIEKPSNLKNLVGPIQVCQNI